MLCRDLSEWQCRIVWQCCLKILKCAAEHWRPFICAEQDGFDTGPVGRLVTDRKLAHWNGYQWKPFTACASLSWVACFHDNPSPHPPADTGSRGKNVLRALNATDKVNTCRWETATSASYGWRRVPCWGTCSEPCLPKLASCFNCYLRINEITTVRRRVRYGHMVALRSKHITHGRRQLHSFSYCAHGYKCQQPPLTAASVFQVSHLRHKSVNRNLTESFCSAGVWA